MLGSLFARAQRGSKPVSPHNTARAALLLLPLGVATLFACSDDGNDTNTNPIVTPTGGAQGGGAPGGGTTGGSQAGGTTGAGATTGGATTGGTPGGATTGGMPGASQPGAAGGGLDAGAPGTAGGSGSPDAGATAGGDAGSDGAVASGLKAKCEGGEPMGCSSFLTPGKIEIQLGPLGAAMDVNVGIGFENTVNTLLDNELACGVFASTFTSDQEQIDKLVNLNGTKLEFFTVYRPATWQAGVKYPVVTWGNGTCAQPEGYGALLRYVASHGFVVVAANSRYVGSGNEQKKGLDFLFKANDDMNSPYYQKIDTTKVAAMGHSQGGSGTQAASSDARIKTVILFNGGTTSTKPFFLVSGDRDIGGGTTSRLINPVNAAAKAAWIWYHMVPGMGDLDGHLTLMLQPERVTGPTVAWLKYLLNDDAESKAWFVGADCKLCGKMADFEFGQKGL